ncbi:hypothetical protein Tco_1236665 [Tanacetum coccineum]
MDSPIDESDLGSLSHRRTSLEVEREGNRKGSPSLCLLLAAFLVHPALRRLQIQLQVSKHPLVKGVGARSANRSSISRVWRLEFQDTANSGKKKETKGMVFYQMEIEEVSDRFVDTCFVNGLEAYDGEINLGVEENMISNEYAIKLCLEHEVKKENKVVKKELIVALRGKIYFVKFIINPKEDDVKPGVIFDRSFLRLTKAITDFGVGTVTIYPDIDPFLEETEEEGKSNDDWDHLLDFNIDYVPLLGDEGLPPFICKMGKSSHNKKRAMENLNFFYQDIGTSSSAGGHLTQEEAAKEAIAIRMSQNFALLEEERPIIETMAYHDKYKKILDEVWKDKVELDGKIIKEEEEAVKRIKGEALKEKDDPGASIFPIKLEGQVNQNALVDTGSNINTMPFRIYVQLGRDDMKKVGVTTLIAKFLILDIPIDRDSLIVVGRGFMRTIGGIVNTPERLFSTFDGFCHQTFHAARSDVMRNAESDSDDEEDYQIKRNKFGAPIYGPKPALWFPWLVPVPLKNVNWKPDYKGSYTKEEEATGQWRTEIRLTDPYGNIYLQGFTPKKTDRKLSKYHKFMSPNLWEHTMMMPDHQDPNAQDNMKPWKRYCFHKFTTSFCYGKDVTEMQILEIDDILREARSDEEIFTSVAWIRAFNINVPIYAGLCHEFYSTYEFDKVCVDDELQTKKIIKFGLGGRAYSLTLLEFARRFVTLQQELIKVIKTKLGLSVRHKDLRSAFKDMVFLLKAAEVFKKANAEGEKSEKNNPATPTKENPDQTQLKNKPPVNEENALVLHALMEKSSEKNVSDDEPPVKKLKFLIPTPSLILSPTPLKSIVPEPTQKPDATKMMIKQITEHLSKTTSSIFSPTPPRELTLPRDPTPPRDESKGKGIATEELLKEIMPFMEEGGSVPKIPSLKSFVIPEGELTNEDVMAQLKEMKRLSDLKVEKEKSEKSLQKIMNPATIRAQAQKMAEYEVVTPPKYDTHRNTTFGVILHNTCTRVLVNVQRYVYKTKSILFIRKIRVT